MQRLIIYKASAGSGKTFKLTEEYLRLAYKTSFSRILAVTFTNKATAEMKERIIGVLHNLAAGKPSPYLSVLIHESGEDEKAVRKRAGELLNEILQNYSRFSVGTIDSFFQKIIRGFAREIGLQSGFELELDNRGVLLKVIDSLIEEAGRNDDLRSWLIRYAETRIREGLSWNIKNDIGRLGEEVFKETYLEFRDELSQKMSDRGFMNQYIASLHSVRKSFEERMIEIGSAALAHISERGLSVTDFSYSNKGVAGYFEKIAFKRQFVPGIRVLDALDDPDSWVTKKSEKFDAVRDAVERELNTLLKKAVALYEAEYPSYNGSALIAANIFTLGILNDLARHIREFASENNFFLLSDVAVLLSGIIGDNDAPFIYEKTGYFYRHFMIDEFQDTSGIQWKNFVPLIRGSLSENHRNILVGDVKQSIYRWRSGDWKILAGGIEEEMRVFTPEIRPLEINWRSKKNILEFNNLVFGIGPGLIRDQFLREYAESGLQDDPIKEMQFQIARAYEGHRQELPDGASGNGGYVEVSFPDNSDGEWRQRVINNLPGLLMDLISRGYELRDIAILVRNRKDGREIAKKLMNWQAVSGEEQGVRLDFVSEEFLLLRESVAVRLIISALSYLVDPECRNNLAVLLNEYCRYCELDPGFNRSDHQLFALQDQPLELFTGKFLPAEFQSASYSLGQLPLYDQVESLIKIFGLGKKVSEIPYLMAFQDVVLDYSKKESGGGSSFLKWWEENNRNFSVSSNDQQDALRIMTIHKSKGLQFRVVLLPFGDWGFDHNPLHDNYIWCKPAEPPFNRLEIVPVKYKSDLARSIFSREYFNEKIQVFVDNLNLLYVALTRAEDELYVFSPLPGKGKAAGERTKSVSELLYSFAGSGPDTYNQAGRDLMWKFEDNILVIGNKLIPERVSDRQSSNEIVLGEYRVNSYKDKLKFKPYGDWFIGADNEPERRVDHGRLMHEIFERIIIADDIENAVLHKYREGIIDRSGAGKIIKYIRDLLQNTDVSGWFDGSWLVRNETGILLADGSIKRPDRVMVKNNRLVVIDYKFGGQVRSDHRLQIRQYMNELVKMGYSDPDGYIWYVPEGRIDSVGAIA